MQTTASGSRSPLDQRRLLSSYVGAWAMLATASCAATVALGDGWSRGTSAGTVLVVGLSLAGIVLGVTRVDVPVRETVESTTLNEVAALPMILLLPPPLALVAALAAGIVSETIVTRGRLQRLAFNVSWQVVGVVVGSWVYWELASQPFSGDLTSTLAGLGAAAAYVLVNHVAFCGVVAIRGRRGLWAVLVEEAPSTLLLSYATALTGVLVAVLIMQSLAAVPLVAIPTILHMSRLRARSEGHVQIAVERGRLQRTVEGTSDGVALLDAVGRIEVWNRQIASFTSVPGEVAIGATLAEVGLGDLATIAAGDFSGGQVHVGDRSFDVRTAVVDDGGPVDAGMVVSLRDVTRESEVARIREDLVSRISHELRTPLATVFGFLETLDARWDGLSDEQRRGLVKVTRRGAGRLASLVSNLMVWARIEARREPEAPAPVVDVAQALGRVLAGVDTTGIETRVHTGARIAMSAEDLLSVLRNLIDNAVIYGRPPLVVAVERRGEHVSISVTDHGPGLPDEYRASLYQPFSQASDGTTRTAKGLGLGLAVVRALVEEAGGHVDHDVPSDAPGTRFTVLLPAVFDDPEPCAVVRGASQRGEPGLADPATVAPRPLDRPSA